MWMAKFKVWHKDCLIRPLCVKYKITDFVYLVSSWEEKSYFFYYELHIIQGSNENQNKFIEEIKKNSSLVSIEVVGNYIYTLNKKSLKEKYYYILFNHKLIYVKPVIQRIDGYEDWEIACIDKQDLMLIKKIPMFKVELIYIKKTKITNIFIPKIFPNISEKQTQALELAVKQGYYEFPRKIKLEELAKLSKVKRQTFQENLRRAERKLIPYLVESKN